MNNEPEKQALRELGSRIKKARSSWDAEQDQPSALEDEQGAQTSAYKVFSEVVITPMVATGVGFALDQWVGTSPILLICFLALGVVTGFYNLIRLEKNSQKNSKQD